MPKTRIDSSRSKVVCVRVTEELLSALDSGAAGFGMVRSQYLSLALVLGNRVLLSLDDAVVVEQLSGVRRLIDVPVLPQSEIARREAELELRRFEELEARGFTIAGRDMAVERARLEKRANLGQVVVAENTSRGVSSDVVGSENVIKGANAGGVNSSEVQKRGPKVTPRSPQKKRR